MGEEQIFDRINRLLSNSGYPSKLKTLGDLKGFLSDESNTQYEAYDEIEDLYQMMMLNSGMW